MKRRAMRIWSVCFALSVWGAASPPTGQAQELELQGLLDQLRGDLQAPGAILGLRLPDGRTITVASGLSDLESGRAMGEADAYFLGSVSKVYTATVTLRLVEEGRLTLEEPLSAYVPSLSRSNEVTLRHLLSHTSGLRDFYSYLYYRPERAEMIELVTKDWEQEDLLGLTERFGYGFDPGTDWSYSNTNYYLLGLIIERVTGMTLADAYRSYIYEPLELKKTWLTWHEPAALPLEVTGYMGPVEGWDHSDMFGELGPTTILDRSPVEWGAGGLAASATDALTFMHGLMTGQLLGQSMHENMTTFRTTPRLGASPSSASEASRSDGYGLGLVRMERPGFTLVGHGGLFTGHTAGLWYVPRCDVTISFFFNRGFVGQRPALDRILPAINRLFPDLGDCATPQ